MVWAPVSFYLREKYRAWCKYKHRSKCQNRECHKQAVAHMEATQASARDQWVESKKREMRGGNVGSKQARLRSLSVGGAMLELLRDYLPE